MFFLPYLIEDLPPYFIRAHNRILAKTAISSERPCSNPRTQLAADVVAFQLLVNVWQVASLEKEKSALLEEEQDLREKVKSLEDDNAQRAAEKTVDEVSGAKGNSS